MSKVKRIYVFGNKTAEGKADMKNLLGGKGANLAEMCLLGLPVPAGFTITTDTCNEYYKNNHELPADLIPELWDAMAKVEQMMGNPWIMGCHGKGWADDGDEVRWSWKSPTG